jgi:serine/threonine protein kinase
MFQIVKSTSGPPRPKTASPLGLDFLDKCFAYDPKDRPSATQLLQHPWVAAPELLARRTADVNSSG